MIRQFLCLLLIPTLIVKSTAMACPHLHQAIGGHSELMHIHLGTHDHGHHHHGHHHHRHDHHDDDQRPHDHPGTHPQQDDCPFSGCLTAHCNHDCDAIFFGSAVDLQRSQSHFSFVDLLRLVHARFAWPSNFSSIEQRQVRVRPPIPEAESQLAQSSFGPLYLQILCLRI